MAGTKGRSGTGNKKSIAELKLTGTYRAHRHDGHELPDGSMVKPEPSIVGDYRVDREQTFKRFAEILHDQQLTDEVDSFIVTQLTDTYCAYVQVSELLATEGLDARIGSKLALVQQTELAKVLRELLSEFRLTPSTRAAQTRTDIKNAKVADDPVGSFLSKPTLVK